MAVVLANLDYFEELSARLVAGAASGEDGAVLTQADLTNLSELVEIQLLVLKDQLESGWVWIRDQRGMRKVVEAVT